MINYQKKQRSKQKNIIHINIQQGVVVETQHEDYLSTTKDRDRHYLMKMSIKFCMDFYAAKKKTNFEEFKYASEILNVLQNSKIPISSANAKEI